MATSWFRRMNGPGKVTGCQYCLACSSLVSAPSLPSPRTHSQGPFRRTELARAPSDSQACSACRPSSTAAAHDSHSPCLRPTIPRMTSVLTPIQCPRPRRRQCARRRLPKRRTATPRLTARFPDNLLRRQTPNARSALGVVARELRLRRQLNCHTGARSLLAGGRAGC